MQPYEDDRELRAWFRRLPRHQPRPGYRQRFWAKAGEVPERASRWSRGWLPAAAAGVGVAAGLLAGLSLPPAAWQRVGGVQELRLAGGLPSGSLAATAVRHGER